MSFYRRHAITGIVVYTFFALSYLILRTLKLIRLPVPFLPLDLRSMVVCVFLAFLSSIFPDVDIKSRAQIFFYRIAALFILALIAAGAFQTAAILALFAITPLLDSHRGWIHSFPAAILIPSLFTLIPILKGGKLTLEGLPFSTASFVGYISHLWLDGMFRRRKRRG